MAKIWPDRAILIAEWFGVDPNQVTEFTYTRYKSGRVRGRFMFVDGHIEVFDEFVEDRPDG